MEEAQGSAFDEDNFMNTEQQGANATEYVPLPEKEVVGLIKDIKFRQAKTSYILDVFWSIDDAEVAEVTGIASPQVRQSIFLDFTEGGSLDMGPGRNVQLGLLRTALNQNDPETAWAPRMLKGQVAKIMIKNRPDKDDPKKIYSDVKAVSPLN